jgi:transcriptional regulator with XRE-family HTH domain
MHTEPTPPDRRYTSIAAYREDTDVSQAVLAKRLGITQSALSMIESGQRMPQPELALKIVQICQVPMQALVRRRVRRRQQQVTK